MSQFIGDALASSIAFVQSKPTSSLHPPRFQRRRNQRPINNRGLIDIDNGKDLQRMALEDDQLLYDNRHLSTVRRASLLGRGMHGVEARLKKLSDVDSTAYARLFGTGNASMHNDGEDDDADKNNKKLTPVKEVLRRIQWDPTLLPSSFTIVHYDRVEDNLCETPFDAPNDSISGKETQFVFALPEHRIERVKYLDRVIWDKEMRLDAVFGSMNGNGMTIDQVIETYDEWKKEKEEREERNRRREMQILGELNLILGEMRMDVLKELSSQLLHNQWETEEIRDYVKRVVGLYHDAKRGNEQDDSIEGSLETKADFIEVVDFLYVLSDLVALLKDALLREEILKELEVAINRSLGESGSSTTMQPGATLPELKEEDLDEKFVKGSGAGGQKVNKTSNRVILLHVPTQIRVECQDTRSLQQNRKIARKRLRLKVDAFLNGESSRTSQKASAAVAKKAKNKSRNKRRRQQKKKKSSDEST
eukprot:CAMPEP_0183748412 /NCGR_PEP_ID=MMETSP0737-20130205/67755_1 /TAXON_ID=385413 /ORGANISM="Thalassiosira miniscula, Strain CCMP1093" /LENGTH=476 /DNA_ID=CAMNT_0025984135 /DNA_START=319 /DNA_END=1750 /DNA_ORIENTATION=-